MSRTKKIGKIFRCLKTTVAGKSVKPEKFCKLGLCQVDLATQLVPTAGLLVNTILGLVGFKDTHLVK